MSRVSSKCLMAAALYLDYYLTLKPTSGYMLHAYSTRTMKKRESITREKVTFPRSFPYISGSEIFISQQETGTEYNDISRETTITPVQWKAKVTTGERLSMPDRKSSTTPKMAFTSCGLSLPLQILERRYCNGVLNGLQHPCTPTNTPCTPIPKIPHIWVFSKSNFIFLKSRYIATSSKLRDSARARLNGARGTCAYFPRAIRESPASIPQNNRLRKTNFNPQIILRRTLRPFAIG